MKRPVIGVSGPDRGGYAAWWFTARAIARAGGKAQRLTPARGFSIEALDGIVLGGGADIHPDTIKVSAELGAVRQAIRHSHMRRWRSYLIYPLIYLLRRLFSIKKPARYDTERDQLEFSLLDAALAARLPVLGICRGAQLINRHQGGSLHEDIAHFYEEEPLPRSLFPVKNILVQKDSHLYQVLGKVQCRVNALHHQAVDTLGRDIRISACEQDRTIVQAIESTQNARLVGVQWHPEYMPFDNSQQQLFHDLVQRARGCGRHQP